MMSSGWCTSPCSLSSHRPGASRPGTRLSYGSLTTSTPAAAHAASYERSEFVVTVAECGMVARRAWVTE